MADFFGSQGNDTLVGFDFDSNDRIFGFAGNDTLEGGSGNDLLEGDSGNDRLSGGLGDDTLTGDDGNDTLEGGSGNDLLEGGGGNDRLSGGLGNDTYIVDNPGDTITEVVDAADVVDVIRSFISLTLPANVETLVLLSGALNGTGNELNNGLRGNSSDNTLKGRAGNDFIVGEEGNDTLLGGMGNDNIVGGIGNDSLSGGMGDDSLSAFVGNDILTGGVGNDFMVGDEGNDTLIGGVGNDRLFGDIGGVPAGADYFRFNAPTEGIDTIEDFVATDDAIQVRASGFGGGLTAGSAISAEQFHLGSVAADANDRFIYDNTNGTLFFDVDGTGTEAQVQLASLTGNPTLTAADILVI